MSHALFPGSFDPVTLGHLDILKRALSLFERVTLAVAGHHDKRSMLDIERRVELLEEVIAGDESLARARVAPLEGLLVEGCRRLGASVVVRGVRGARDLEYEREMALTNRAMAPEIETVLILPAPEYAHVSSTLVRQIARLGGDVAPFVPPAVRAALALSGP